MNLSATNYGTLAEMIAPALFMTATGSLIVSTTTRIGRIVDRIRVLVELGDSISRGSRTDLDFPEIRTEQIIQHLGQLEQRSKMALGAIRFLYLAFGLFVASSLAVAIDTLFNHYLAVIPIIFSVCGVTSMLSASINLVREVLLALKNNNMSLQFFRELQKIRAQNASPMGKTDSAIHTSL